MSQTKLFQKNPKLSKRRSYSIYQWPCSSLSQLSRYYFSFFSFSVQVSTFNLVLTLREESSFSASLRNWFHQLVFANSSSSSIMRIRRRRCVVVVSQHFELRKEKLYRSPSGTTLTSFQFWHKTSSKNSLIFWQSQKLCFFNPSVPFFSFLISFFFRRGSLEKGAGFLLQIF